MRGQRNIELKFCGQKPQINVHRRIMWESIAAGGKAGAMGGPQGVLVGLTVGKKTEINGRIQDFP